MKGFLDYVPGDSLLHRLNPLTKLVLPLLICAACFTGDGLLFVLAIILLDVALAALGGVTGRALSMLKTLAKLSVFLFVIQVIFIGDGRVLLSLPLGLCITDQGIRFSLLLVLRLMGATLPLALMLSVTKPSDLSGALVGVLGVPYPYAFALTTAIRFIPLFSEEMAGIMEAQTARGVEFDTKNIFKKIRLILPLCVPLLISSVRKIDDGAVSAQLRGFHLRNRQSGVKRYGFAARDGAAILFGAGLLALGIFL